MHTVLFTLAPEGLLGGNFIAAFFFSRTKDVPSKTWILRVWRFYLAVTGWDYWSTVKTVSIDLLGSLHSETFICRRYYWLSNNKGRSLCVSQLAARILDPCTSRWRPYHHLCPLHSRAEQTAKLETSCPDLAALAFSVSGYFPDLSLWQHHLQRDRSIDHTNKRSWGQLGQTRQAGSRLIVNT